MRLTVFPCHAEADREVVDELGVFLGRSCDLEWCVEEGRLGPDGDLIDKIEEALQADAVLVLLSPDSTPARWVRERWEPVLVERPKEYGTRVALGLVAECRYPPLLRNQTFFDLTQDRLGAFRRIKQWVLQMRPLPNPISFAPPAPHPALDREAELEELRRALSDEPGVVRLACDGQTALAAEFARRFDGDFQGVFWVYCGDRSPARVAGELAAQLGLRLEGEATANQEALRRFCAERRCLIVLEGARSDAAAPLIPGGRASVLLTTERTAPSESEWDVALRSLLDARDWAGTCGLVRQVVRQARYQGRLAEADEFLQLWGAAAEEREDRRILEECAWERIWILESWGRVEEAARLEAYRRSALQDQICFDFIGLDFSAQRHEDTKEI
jgi:hypothetical protein